MTYLLQLQSFESENSTGFCSSLKKKEGIIEIRGEISTDSAFSINKMVFT